MKRIAHLTKYRPSDAFWLLVTVIALALVVAAPAAAWIQLESALYAGTEALR